MYNFIFRFIKGPLDERALEKVKNIAFPRHTDNAALSKHQLLRPDIEYRLKRGGRHFHGLPTKLDQATSRPPVSVSPQQCEPIYERGPREPGEGTIG